MTKISDSIVEILREELEQHDSLGDYSQWVLGVSIIKKGADQIYIARVAVKTNESPYVDGMDIFFMEAEDEVVIEVNYFEKTPVFNGGTVEDCITWLKELNDICYLQLQDPYQ
ncbi:hypothetical protein [Alkalibaculum bacchi]|uniref:hypothetical protein n=1 Tax=Alkalibaculum bacchi TaxID=645887 RepID=UPI0026F323F1|nr:hypothetical protein [Alkalibaculum bacchi]